MNMIEAGARAMFRLEDTEGEEWDSKHIMEDVRESYREAARACWTAMVEGLTDEQCKGIRYSMKCENPVEFRTALVAATEVE